MFNTVASAMNTAVSNTQGFAPEKFQPLLEILPPEKAKDARRDRYAQTFRSQDHGQRNWVARERYSNSRHGYASEVQRAVDARADQADLQDEISSGLDDYFEVRSNADRRRRDHDNCVILCANKVPVTWSELNLDPAEIDRQIEEAWAEREFDYLELDCQLYEAWDDFLFDSDYGGDFYADVA